MNLKPIIQSEVSQKEKHKYFILIHIYIYKISVLHCAHHCMKCSLGISNFLEEISSLSHSLVFLYFFALITEEGFLISPCCSLELCVQMDISFLFSFAFCFSSFHSWKRSVCQRILKLPKLHSFHMLAK